MIPRSPCHASPVCRGQRLLPAHNRNDFFNLCELHLSSPGKQRLTLTPIGRRRSTIKQKKVGRGWQKCNLKTNYRMNNCFQGCCCFFGEGHARGKVPQAKLSAQLLHRNRIPWLAAMCASKFSKWIIIYFEKNSFVQTKFHNEFHHEHGMTPPKKTKKWHLA